LGWQDQSLDPDSGQELTAVCRVPKTARRVPGRFQPNGQLLGVVGMDDPNPTARATLFDVPTRRVVRELAGHSMTSKAFASARMGNMSHFGPGFYGQNLVGRSAVGFVSLEGHSQVVWTGGLFAGWPARGHRRLDQNGPDLDASTGELLQTLVVRFPVVSLAFSHDAKLVTVGPENSACVWADRAESGKQKAERGKRRTAATARAHTRGAGSAWSPDDAGSPPAARTRREDSDANTGAWRLSLIGHSNLSPSGGFLPGRTVRRLAGRWHRFGFGPP